MTDILVQRIQSVKLTKTQQKIAAYFIQNQERIGMLSSVEVAREIGVSDASIIRFSRAIGYDGFSDLKSDIYKTLTQDASENFSTLTLNERMALSEHRYPNAEVSLQYLDLMQESLANAFRINRQETFSGIVDAIISAQDKYVLGFRGCLGIASHFSRALTFMTPNVHYLTGGESDALNLLLDVTANDIVIFFSFRRYYDTDVYCMKMAKKHGARICLITDDRFGLLSQYADLLLIADTSQTSFFNSTVSTTMMSEYLLTLIGRKVNFTERMSELDEYTKGFLSKE